MKKRIKNETGEKIEIEDGGTITITGDTDKVRLMASRREILIVKEVG